MSEKNNVEDIKKIDRYIVLLIIMILIFSMVIIRLFYLQVMNGEQFKVMANDNAVRYIPEPAPRGSIFDRNGNVLAASKQSYMLVYIQTENSMENFFSTFKEVFSLLGSSMRINENGEVQKEDIKDDFELKVNPFRFDFRTDDKNANRCLELRFKKDRGLHSGILRKIEQEKDNKTNLNDELIKLSAEECFYKLVYKYKLYRLLELTKEQEARLVEDYESGNLTNKQITEMIIDKFTIEELRRYMVIKDSIIMQSFTGYKPVIIASNIDRKTAFIFEQVKHELPGIEVTMHPIRYYPNNELGANFIGYVSRINSGRKEDYEQRGYDINSDLIGMSGLESAFEERLKGSKGGITVKINKYGRKIDELFRLDPSPGQNMILTIDKTLQMITEKSLETVMQDLQKNHKHGKDTVDTKNATRGAAVVLDVRTGAVLAMASNPSYDPNIFSIPGKLTPEISRKYFLPDFYTYGEEYIKKMKLKISIDDIFPLQSNNIREDIYDIYPKPFYNYATCGLIPPGSTFKPLTALAGLEEGVITSSSKISDAGIFDEHPPYTDNYKGACWLWNEHKHNHPPMDVKKALEVSCNYFFYEVSHRLFRTGGLDNLAKYAWRFGLGVDPKSKIKPTTGIEIAENFGQVYNNQSRKNLAARQYKFGLVETLNVGKYYDNNGRTYNYKPLLIADDVSDNKELRDEKNRFKATIYNEITGAVDEKQNYNKFKFKILPSLVHNLMSKYSKERREAYTSKDIELNIEVIADYIYYTVIKEATITGNIYDASIGQGMSNFTPLQMAGYISTLANGGSRYRIRLVEKVTDSRGNIIEEFGPELLDKITLKADTVRTVKEGMKRVTSDDGTASEAFREFPIQTAGKTGSATYKENGKQEELGRTSYGIYLGFAPFNDPEIAVCVVIFDGGHGGYVAPVARAIYEAYFRERLNNIKGFRPMFDFTMNP
jgi:penicillin-binding protein 2